MKILDLPQNSAEWLVMRSQCITSSDSSIIIGVNPFENVNTLWKRKLGLIPPIVINDKMLRGQRLEPIARDLLCAEIGIYFEPMVGLHDTETWCMTSLDGIDKSGKFICELKAPNLKTHLMAMNGKLPSYYLCQCQHHLFCSGAEKCYYYTYCPEHDVQTALVEIERDEEYIENMIEMEFDFWDNHLTNFCEPKDWVFKKKAKK